MAFAPAAAAEDKSPYRGGMRYSVMGSATQAETGAGNKADSGRLNNITKQPPPAAESKAQDEEDSSRRVWNKYKALAAGEPGEQAKEDEEKESGAKTEPEQADASDKKEPAGKPSTFSTIIDRYQQNKLRQSQMQSLTMHTPEAPPTSEKTKTEPKEETKKIEDESPGDQDGPGKDQEKDSKAEKADASPGTN